MLTNSIIPIKPLTEGFYKIISIDNYPTAIANFRGNLKSTTGKVLVQINISPLFDSTSNPQATDKLQLINKVLQVFEVNTSGTQWRVLNREILEELTAEANRALTLNDLSLEQMCMAYDQLKTELNKIELSDEEIYGTNDDSEEDYKG